MELNRKMSSCNKEFINQQGTGSRAQNESEEPKTKLRRGNRGSSNLSWFLFVPHLWLMVHLIFFYILFFLFLPPSTTTVASRKQKRRTIEEERNSSIKGGREFKRNILWLLNLDDSKEAVYGTLDSWVAWEQDFPIAALKNVLLTLEKDQQWHRVVQVLKWLLSKGQGNTMGTYRQLIRALDMDHRGEEAHQFWVRKIGHDIQPVPWQICSLMISIYYRNNKFDDLVKLFKSLEAFGRKPPEKSIVQKVVNAYEILGMVDEKERVMQKYSDLLSQTRKEADEKKKSKKSKSSKIKSSGAKTYNRTPRSAASDEQSNAAEQTSTSLCS